MTFFADENFILRAALLLGVLDPRHEVLHLTHRFTKGTPDTVWIEAVSRWSPRPVILGGDGRILKNRAERAALRSADLSFVYLAGGWTNLEWSVFAWKIVKAWPGIVERVERSRIPTVFEVKAGTLKVHQLAATARL